MWLPVSSFPPFISTYKARSGLRLQYRCILPLPEVPNCHQIATIPDPWVSFFTLYITEILVERYQISPCPSKRVIPLFLFRGTHEWCTNMWQLWDLALQESDTHVGPHLKLFEALATKQGQDRVIHKVGVKSSQPHPHSTLCLFDNVARRVPTSSTYYLKDFVYGANKRTKIIVLCSNIEEI